MAQILLFSGDAGQTGWLNDTWIFNPNSATWTEASAIGSPDVSGGNVAGNLVFVDSIGKFLTIIEGQTWTYDPSRSLWERLEVIWAPPVREGASLAYNSLWNKVILFGGFGTGSGEVSNKTFVFDISQNRWADLNPKGSVPYVVGSVGIAYMRSVDRIIVFGAGGTLGGEPNACKTADATWELDLTNKTWNRLSPKTSPSGRNSELAYVGSLDRVMLYSGMKFTGHVDYWGREECNLGPGAGETWAFDYQNQTWYEIRPAHSPPPLYYHGLVYDSSSGSLVLFGGTPGVELLNETWVFVPGTNSFGPNPGEPNSSTFSLQIPILLLAFVIVAVLMLLFLLKRRVRRRSRDDEQRGYDPTSLSPELVRLPRRP